MKGSGGALMGSEKPRFSRAISRFMGVLPVCILMIMIYNYAPSAPTEEWIPPAELANKLATQNVTIVDSELVVIDAAADKLNASELIEKRVRPPALVTVSNQKAAERAYGKQCRDNRKPGTLYVHVSAGMGNRLRTIASATWLAKKLEVPLSIVWNEEKLFSGQWKDFYSQPPLSFSDFPSHCCTEEEMREYNVEGCHNVPEVGFKGKLWKQVAADWMDSGCKEDLCITSTFEFAWPHQTGLDIGYLPSNFLETMDLSPKLEKSIQTFKKKVEWDEWGQWVTFHIRRTDLSIGTGMMKDVIQISSYVNVAKEVLKLAPDARFFVATDDPEAEEEFMDLLGEKAVKENRVVAFPKPVRDATFAAGGNARNDTGAVKEGVIDMFLLGSGKLVVGTYYSSYSEISAQLNRLPLILIGPGDFKITDEDREQLESTFRP